MWLRLCTTTDISSGLKLPHPFLFGRLHNDFFSGSNGRLHPLQDISPLSAVPFHKYDLLSD